MTAPDDPQPAAGPRGGLGERTTDLAATLIDAAGGASAAVDAALAEAIARDVERTLAEDIGSGDVTAQLLPDAPADAYVLCKQDGVLAGAPWFDAVLRALDPDVRITWRVTDGSRIHHGQVLATIAGRTRALVSGERSALNLLQTLAGTATTTAAYVEAVRGTAARILDTRKTLPGLRIAQKYAVKVGGAVNHRIGLFDAVMLKENHLHAVGSLSAAVNAARIRYPTLPLIVEVEDLHELDAALACPGVDRILVDDFSLADMREAVRRAAGRVPLEVSGGVDLDGIAAIAQTGVDFISVGALTKHVYALDLSMKLGPAPA